MASERKPPKKMTELYNARTGLLSAHALRIMLKAGKLPAKYIGKKALINHGRPGAALRAWKPKFRSRK